MSSSINFIHWLQHFSSYLPWIGLIVFGVAAIGLVLAFVRRILALRHLLKQKVAYLELTPPAFTDKTPAATNQLNSVLHNLGSRRSFMDKLLDRETVFSLEIVSSRELGIRYIIRLAKGRASSFEQAVHAYLPEVQIRRVKSYLSGDIADNQARLVTFKQKEHFAYPLQSHDFLDQHDPIAYLTNAMTKLNSDEVVVFQLIMAPTTVPEARVIRKKILSNEDLSSHLQKRKLALGASIIHGLNKLLFGLIDAIGEIQHGQPRYDYSAVQQDAYQQRQVAMKMKPARSLSMFEQEHIESIHDKVNQPLFKVDIRALVFAGNKTEALRRLDELESAMASYSVAGYQALDSKRAKLPLIKKYHWFVFINRLPALFSKQSNLLSVSEISSLYHFPHSETAKTENVVKALSKKLPAPVSLKDGSKLDILFGMNHYHGSETPIGLTEAERERHVYIIGGTGNGKTTMLMYAIEQDIKNGKGVAVIDPHGDLAETILGYIPEERVKDVIYLNPDDLSHPIGINLLEFDPGLSGDELLREKDLVTESTISVLRKIFSEDDSGGHRIEYILRNAIQTALTLENPTLFTIFRLLNDTKYRQKVVRELEDNDLKIFWKNEIAKAGEMQRVKMSAGITSKIGRFLFSASARRILEQEKSTINFEEILDSKKILVCNFSKGLIGEDTSSLFGTAVLAKLQMAALKRARHKQVDRQPYYLYVDEFQNFATMSFVQMLSEARKYKLFLTMAEQSTQQQQQQRLVDVILANVGTVVCFRSGSPADERLVLPLFSPFIEQGEISNLPAYNFYMRIASVDAKEPLSGTTLLIEVQPDEATRRKVIVQSRTTYSLKVKKVKPLKTKPKTSEVKPEEKVADIGGARPSSADQLSAATEQT